MIRYYEDDKECYVDISGKRVEIIQADRTAIVAECRLCDLKDESGSGFSENLTLYLNSEDGFGTGLFYAMLINNIGTKLELVFLSNLGDDNVDDATDFAHMVDSIPGKIFKDGGFRSSGLSISYTPVELAVIKEITLTENIYDAIQDAALKINKLFGLKSQ